MPRSSASQILLAPCSEIPIPHPGLCRKKPIIWSHQFWWFLRVTEYLLCVLILVITLKCKSSMQSSLPAKGCLVLGFPAKPVGIQFLYNASYDYLNVTYVQLLFCKLQVIANTCYTAYSVQSFWKFYCLAIICKKKSVSMKYEFKSFYKYFNLYLLKYTHVEYIYFKEGIYFIYF